MVTKRHCVEAMLVIIPMFVLSGCPTRQSPPRDAGFGDGAVGSSDGTPSTTKGDLASACTASADCTSGFCADGVCCDSACGQQCYSCATTAAPGHCGPLTGGPDLAATTPCTNGSTCILDTSTNVPACKLQNLEKCTADGDCASGHCLTFFVDNDGDGYGTATTASVCTTLNAPPPSGYAVLPGDCCDIDSGANPGLPADTYFQFADACSSFDWNCDGTVEQEKTCPVAVTCGADCVEDLGIFTFTAFTEECH